MNPPPAAPTNPSNDATTTVLWVEGMTCQNCARRVTEAIQGTPGVRSASISLDHNSATVRWQSGSTPDVSAVIAAIQKVGYDAKKAATETSDSAAPPRAGWRINLWLGLAVTVSLMIGEWGFGLGMTPWFQWFAFALAGVVQVICGAQFYRGAWRQLKVGNSNMDTLVALGSSTAFGYSTWALLSGAGGHLYFMEAAAIISIISAGHWIEARVSDQAGGALKSLLNLAPQTARRLSSRPEPSRGAGNKAAFRGMARLDLDTLDFSKSSSRNLKSEIEQEVPVRELKINDCIALRPGDRVPVDGVVVDGESALDEAMLTGESVPVDKKAGSELFAGTVNLNGRLVMRVTATGESTALAHVIAAVQRAQTSRANIQRLGDRISSVFVPIIVSIALAAGLWWSLAPESAQRVHDSLAPFFWLTHAPTGAAAGFIIAAAVLIIACPCAMGLATPAAIMASANTAARRGILIRDGVALEKAGEVTAVVFDKTGTLTAGKPELIGTWCVTGAESDVLSEAANLARHSTHPISQALAKISAETLEVTDWKEIRGNGVEASMHPSNTKMRLGSLRWLREIGTDLAAGEAFIAEWSQQGATVVGLASGQTLHGLFAVRDVLKPKAQSVVEQLQRQGLNVYLLTGDNRLTAASIAEQVGIPTERVFAEVRPEEKAEFVKKLQAQGERVAFVGDGINDAPALMQADLGIAVSRASDVAREAADIILLKSEIEAVTEALGLARATLRTIKQNLFWAFFYNTLGVPLAALGFISPIFCAVAMGMSDLIVIGNALRLLRWRQK